ncbi:MAG: hypothetical protein GX654_04120 [Desulfatiglans sp.]|nr:hypothetical protein [Desulfatiglans sp.]
MTRHFQIKAFEHHGFFVCVLAVILFGCTGPGTSRMVPLDMPMAGKTITKTVRVGQVSGEVKEAGNAKNSQIRDALVRGLNQAKYFRAVVLEGQSDLELRATVIAQRFKDRASFKTRNEITINYKLIENGSGSILWQETILSEAGSNAFAGATRLSEACEGAVRENIALFLSELSRYEWK